MAQGAQSGELLLIATPIGNLADLTRRAADALAGLDLLLCEDTRITARLIGHLGLRVPLRAYHDHNADRQRPAVLAALAVLTVLAAPTVPRRWFSAASARRRRPPSPARGWPVCGALSAA
ncbi:MAG: hypothetical protein VXY90_07830 [Pseudomonadota bacterium]|nr:hypothetical protein [Pseudomonadota bacterium]